MKIQQDLTSRKEIEQLVNGFYEQVKKDPLLAPHFQEVNWEIHLPVMYNFWSSVILGDQSYQGNPFQKHIHLPIGQEHFSRWLALFTQTVDDHFEGENSEAIKNRAHTIAQVFQHKMGLLKPGT
jgi:hemoglobin